MLNKLSELEIGKAAEHLVCADLILKGYRSFLADQGLPFFGAESPYIGRCCTAALGGATL